MTQLAGALHLRLWLTRVGLIRFVRILFCGVLGLLASSSEGKDSWSLMLRFFCERVCAKVSTNTSKVKCTVYRNVLSKRDLGDLCSRWYPVPWYILRLLGQPVER